MIPRWARRMVALATVGVAPAALAQGGTAAPAPVARASAIAAALAAGPRMALARTDTAAAAGALASARAYPNPALLASYTKAVPQYHLSLDQPIEYPWLRSARADAAAEFRRASLYRFAFERSAVEFDADTAYTVALAARAHARLAQRAAQDADSLLTLTRLRRDAGDASELDVELAVVVAGQGANGSANDSLAALAALLDLQRVMGLPADRARIALTDSLVETPSVDTGSAGGVGVGGGAPLAIAAAEASARGAERGLAVESRSVFTTPSLQLGVENHDPTGAEPGMLPMIGLSLPLPLWNQHGGEIASARAGLARAQAELAYARRESDAQIARARRELASALARVARDRALLSSAQHVAAMSLTAYGEGAAGLPTVLEAQRAARDAVARYIDDLAAAQTAAALLRLHTSTAALP